MRIVNRKFLIELLDEYYKEQENVCSFCGEAKCSFCQKSYFLEEEIANLVLLTLVFWFGKKLV